MYIIIFYSVFTSYSGHTVFAQRGIEPNMRVRPLCINFHERYRPRINISISYRSRNFLCHFINFCEDTVLRVSKFSLWNSIFFSQKTNMQQLKDIKYWKPKPKLAIEYEPKCGIIWLRQLMRVDFSEHHLTVASPFVPTAFLQIFNFNNSVYKRLLLKSDSHLPENFCQIKIFHSHVRRNTTINLFGV